MFEAVIDSECDSTGLASHFGVADFDGGGDGDLIGRVYLQIKHRCRKVLYKTYERHRGSSTSTSLPTSPRHSSQNAQSRVRVDVFSG